MVAECPCPCLVQLRFIETETGITSSAEVVLAPDLLPNDDGTLGRPRHDLILADAIAAPDQATRDTSPRLGADAHVAREARTTSTLTTTEIAKPACGDLG